MSFQLKYGKLRSPAIAVLLLAALLLSASGQADRVVRICGLDSLYQSNDRYLETSFDTALKGFLILSAIKSGVAVLEGSEVGVAFNLQVGDIVQSIYDYVDIAWKSALAGCTILFLMRMVLQTMQSFGHYLLAGTVAAALIVHCLRWWLPNRHGLCRLLKECVLLLAAVTLAMYLLLPLSIAGASFLSAKITRPLLEEAHAGFEAAESDFAPQALMRRMFPQDQETESFWSRLDVRDKLAESRQAIGRMAAWLKEITRDFATWTIMLIAGYLFDCLVFPLAFFIVVYLLSKMFLASALGMSRAQSLREDLDMIFARYAAPRYPERKQAG